MHAPAEQNTIQLSQCSRVFHSFLPIASIHEASPETVAWFPKSPEFSRLGRKSRLSSLYPPHQPGDLLTDSPGSRETLEAPLSPESRCNRSASQSLNTEVNAMLSFLNGFLVFQGPQSQQHKNSSRHTDLLSQDKHKIRSKQFYVTKHLFFGHHVSTPGPRLVGIHSKRYYGPGDQASWN